MVSSCEVLGTGLWGCEGHQEVWLEAVPCSVSPLHIPTWTGVGVWGVGGKGSNGSVPETVKSFFKTIRHYLMVCQQNTMV